MFKLIRLDCDSNFETIEFLSRLSELVKCTLGGFELVHKDLGKLISTINFAFRFSHFLPDSRKNINDLSYGELFVGRDAPALINIYKKLLDIFFELKEFKVSPVTEPLCGYLEIEKGLREVDSELDQVLKKILER